MTGPDDPCPPDFEFYNVEGRCYLVKEGSSNEKSVADATALCTSRGAALVSFETAAELAFVGSLFTVDGNSNSYNGANSLVN